MNNVFELLTRAEDRTPDAVFLRYKRDGAWRDRTYGESLERTRRCAAALKAHGAHPGDHVALSMENGPEWFEMYFGIQAAGCTAVPIDPKLKGREISHLLLHAECRLALTSATAYGALRDAADHLPELKTALILGGAALNPPEHERVRYEDYETALNTQPTPDATSPKTDPDSPASIIYTSGTTGGQKGVLLTHGNFLANVDGCMNAVDITPQDRFMLVLPLHHVFAFTANLLLPMAAGASIIFAENLKTVGDNIRETSPTTLMTVPLLTEKIYDRIWHNLRRNKIGYTLYRLGVRGPVRRKIRDGLGGAMRLMISGGAPADPRVLRGFQALGITILEGYGLTETAPVLTLNPPDAPRFGTVGRPFHNVELRILDPNAEGVGEIAARGPSIMPGYYRADDLTRDAFRDGWFLTGDLGRMDEDGYLTITGRRKNLIVNREGKNIYPEEIEHCVAQSPYILEALAVGIPRENERGEQVGLIAVPDQEAIDGDPALRKRASDDEGLRALITAEVKRLTAELTEYKRPRHIRIRREEFEKTPTGKIKRYLYASPPVAV